MMFSLPVDFRVLFSYADLSLERPCILIFNESDRRNRNKYTSRLPSPASTAAQPLRSPPQLPVPSDNMTTKHNHHNRHARGTNRPSQKNITHD